MEPSLVNANSLDEDNWGDFAWEERGSDYTTISNDGRTITWDKMSKTAKYAPSWVGASTLTKLHSGKFEVELLVEKMGGAQIGIGFMLLWDVGLDWGFFGYLGSSSTAWAYDPSTGDVVTNTKSIQGGLPTFKNGESGTIRIEFDLPRKSQGDARFEVDGIKSGPIQLPESSAAVIAASLLRMSQQVTLQQIERL